MPPNQYMELFPYIDSLWFGEGFNYNESPDYWLVEIAGIPYGLFGEMLQGGGNPWRGMIYGMTNRLGWCGDPRPMWKVWDSVRHSERPHDRLLGPGLPGQDRPQGRAGHGIRQARQDAGGGGQLGADRRSSASWKSTGSRSISIPPRRSFRAGEMKDFQPAAEFRLADDIPIQPGRGWLLLLHQ